MGEGGGRGRGAKPEVISTLPVCVLTSGSCYVEEAGTV